MIAGILNLLHFASSITQQPKLCRVSRIGLNMTHFRRGVLSLESHTMHADVVILSVDSKGLDVYIYGLGCRVFKLAC